MSEQILKSGRFKALAISSMITENNGGNPQAVIQLEVEFDDEKKIMNYYGQLTGGAVEHTLKALVACGIKGNSVMDSITKGTEVSVVIDVEPDKEGKQRQKVSWVNKPLSMGKPIDPMKAKSALEKFEGALARMRQNEPSQSNPPNLANTDIPF